MLYKFSALQITGALLLFAAYLSGILDTLLDADKTHAIPILGALTVVGLYMVARNALEGATWLSDKLPVVGLLGTVYGVLEAVRGITGLSLEEARLYVFSHTADALVSNALGMLGYLWLNLTIKVVK